MNKKQTESKLKGLLDIKQNVSSLNNMIHDLAADLTILSLKKRHPGVTFVYQGAGVGGIDIQGHVEGKLEVCCEVSTHDKYQGNRRSNIDDDFSRLENCQCNHKYLSVIYVGLESSLNRNRKIRGSYPSVKIIRVL